MEKSKINPLIAGLINMLLPGSINVYVKREWRNFVLTFVGVELVLAIAIWLGLSIQSARFFSFPQGICPGVLMLIVLVPLFLSGLNSAKEFNKHMDDKVLYQSRKPVNQDDEDEQLQKIQKMRDEGLISKKQYDTRKDNIVPKK